ncbi:cytochrome P450 2C31-like [Ostrea edulis]|uniref:cytochrome P450 2C31-like n=1 Tax=Ostrea edulis TaxID=37623 RepID=UPI0024AF4A78|nr:cytochrome P450 2C31-like [Ostrea edulis]
MTLFTRTNPETNQSIFDFVVLLTILSIVFFIIHLILEWRQKPPGPWGLPVVGHLPFLGSKPLDKFKQYQKEYGDVFCLRFGMWPTVVIRGRDTVKSTLAHQSDHFASRPPFFSVKSVSDMKGLTFSEFDERYLLHRKIASSVIREIGSYSKSELEDVFRDESNILVSSFLANEGKPFNPRYLVYIAAGSIMYQFCYGKGENIRDDPAFLKVMKDQEIFQEFFAMGNYFDVFPWLQYIMPNQFNKFLETIKNARCARKEDKDDIIKTFYPNNPRHALDGIRNACLKYNITDVPNEMGLTKAQLIDTLDDFFTAGFETISSTLRWALMYFAEYEDIQLKVQREIEERIGRNKVLSVKDRHDLPYTEATILEIMRVAPAVPMGLPHQATNDVFVKGNLIEKGTVVFFNLISVMHDEYWGNPHEFQPGRFLDDKGNLMKQKVDNVLSFSAGRRNCVGKMIAQAEIFYLLATVLQNCKICKPEDTSYDFEGLYELSYYPKEYELCVHPR